MKELSIVIPFFNEEKNVESVVSELSSVLNNEKIDYELILVNNGSNDNTRKIIHDLCSNKKYREVIVEKNEGYGNGIIHGLKKSSGKIVGYIDGDGQIKPEDVVKCYNEIIKGYDLCKGEKKVENYTLLRKISSKVFNFLFAVLFFINDKGVNSKPKLMKIECYKKMNLRAKNFFIDGEIMIKAKKLKLKVKSIPTELRKRREGKSHVRMKVLFEFFFDIFKFKYYEVSGKLFR